MNTPMRVYKEAREKAKVQREEAIQKRREECEKQIEENRNGDADIDTVGISEEGKVLLIL